MAAERLRVDPDPPPPAMGSLQAANLPQALRAELLPALQELVARHHPEGLRLRQLGAGQRQPPLGCGSAGDGSGRPAPARRLLLDANCVVLEALQPCRLPVQPLVASPALLLKHGDVPFWRSVKAEAIPMLRGCRFP